MKKIGLLGLLSLGGGGNQKLYLHTFTYQAGDQRVSFMIVSKQAENYTNAQLKSFLNGKNVIASGQMIHSNQAYFAFKARYNGNSITVDGARYLDGSTVRAFGFGEITGANWTEYVIEF